MSAPGGRSWVLNVPVGVCTTVVVGVTAISARSARSLSVASSTVADWSLYCPQYCPLSASQSASRRRALCTYLDIDSKTLVLSRFVPPTRFQFLRMLRTVGVEQEAGYARRGADT